MREVQGRDYMAGLSAPDRAALLSDDHLQREAARLARLVTEHETRLRQADEELEAARRVNRRLARKIAERDS